MWSKARTYLLCVFSGTGAVQGTIQQPQTIMYLFFYSIKDLSVDNTSGLPIMGKKVASISLIMIMIIITDHNLDLQELCICNLQIVDIYQNIRPRQHTGDMQPLLSHSVWELRQGYFPAVKSTLNEI